VVQRGEPDARAASGIFARRTNGRRGCAFSLRAVDPHALVASEQLLSFGPVFTGCATHREAGGNYVNGFPVQRYTFLSLVPGLTLSGFSTAGCPVDSGIGGSLTYSVPVQPATWLVAGLGVYGTPRSILVSQRQSDLRIDLVHAIGKGRTIGIGIGLEGLAVGGLW
jgi:hypothetical protein